MTKTTLSLLLAGTLLAGCTADDNPIHNAVRSLHGGHERVLADLDRDGDGKVSLAEAREAKGPASMLQQHFAAVDLDGDGLIDADELGQFHDDIAAVHADGGAQLFLQLDTNRDGKLSVTELRASPGLGEMLADHLAKVDSDGDELISKDELAAAIARHDQPHD